MLKENGIWGSLINKKALFGVSRQTPNKSIHSQLSLFRHELIEKSQSTLPGSSTWKTDSIICEKFRISWSWNAPGANVRGDNGWGGGWGWAWGFMQRLSVAFWPLKSFCLSVTVSEDEIRQGDAAAGEHPVHHGNGETHVPVFSNILHFFKTTSHSLLLRWLLQHGS